MKSLRFSAAFLCLGVSLCFIGCGGASSGTSSTSGGSGGSGGTSPTPAITSISPTTVAAGSGDFTLTVNGSGFLSTTVIQVNGVADATTFVSATQVTAAVKAAQVASGANLSVVAVNGSQSSSGTTTSLQVTNPAPTVTTAAPNSFLTGATSPVVTLTGTGFVSATVVNVNGSARPTTYISATQVSATLSASDVASAGTLALTAVNATPGGGTSSAVNVTIVAPNPAPVIASLSPSPITAGGSSQVVTVTGTGFLNSTVIQVNGSARSTTFTSASQVAVTLTSADLAATGTLTLTAVNPSPGGGTSAGVSLPVVNPAPSVTSIAPATAAVGPVDITATVTGSGFVASTVMQVNGSNRPTTYVNATSLHMQLTPADLATTGTLSVTAVNAAPGGGTSAAVKVPVINPVPTSLVLTPSSLVINGSAPVTVTVNGTFFVPGAVVNVNGAARSATYVNFTTVTFTATVADQSTTGTLAVTVTNPAPGGGTSTAVNLTITPPTPPPTISSVLPNSFYTSTIDNQITVFGTGFVSTSVVQWNGTPLASALGASWNGNTLTATVPAANLSSAGTANITVYTPTSAPSTSNAVPVTITNPPAPTLTYMYPSGGPISTAAQVALSGTGFTSDSTVAINGVTVPSTYANSTDLTVNIPASAVAVPGNYNITVTTPAPGGGTTAALVYSAYISIPNNDIVYNSADGLLYASVPASAAGAIGNVVVGIDPNTGTIKRQIQVGTNPNRLALSTDGTQLFVGIDGAGAVAQVNLAQGKVVNQFSLGGGSGLYNAPYTAAYMAAVPGLPNSVAVATTGEYGSGSSVTIFDSGVARTGSSVTVGEGPLSFGSSASTLYVGSSYIDALTVGSTGITNSTQLDSTYTNLSWLQYDNGSLYLSNGQVLNATTGALNGTFYTATNAQANGPVVSDSTLGKAFMAVANYSNNSAVYVFDETSFNLLGSIPVNALGISGYGTTFRKIVRWGQNGIAVAAVPSAFTSNNQIYIFQSPLVKDVSSTPADLSVSLTVPSSANTGSPISYVATVTNAGPNPASGATFAGSLDPSLIINSVTASQGPCVTAATFTCDLGSLAKGASVTVTVNATPTVAGTFAATASIMSSSFDPTASNNQATVSTTVTGSLYSAVPSISSISPNLVQAGSAAFTLTVNGTGFNTGSTVNLANTALTTTYVSPTQVTASVPASAIGNYGWAPVTVSNAAPGGGESAIAPLTIYGQVSIPANSIVFDPYSQSIYATVASNATGITGNSVVAINPFTSTIGTPVAVGSQPTVMAETTDGNYLYIGLSGSNSLAQFNLISQKLTATAPLTIPQGTSSTATSATWLNAMPGSDNTVVIDTGYTGGGIGIFDFTGTTGAFRKNLSTIYTGNFPTFGDASHVYSFDDYTSGGEFYRFSVDSNGLNETDGSTLKGFCCGPFSFANGRVYGAGGGIINPSATPPSQLQTLPLIDFYGYGDVGSGVGALADPSLQKDFLMLENTAGEWAYGLVRYDLTTDLPEAFLEMPQGASGVDSSWTMLRFGQDGLAMLSSDTLGVTTPVVQLMLFRGPFIAPQELSTNTAASLTSSSAPSITHGAGNTMMTLTGSNFQPGVAVTWNGSYRTTTIVDATHVSVAIPASDLATAGSASVVATNPGGPASNKLTITIN